MILLSPHFSVYEARCREFTIHQPCPLCHGIYIPNEILLDALEEFRSILGMPFITTSWVRCPAKERQMKPHITAPKSEHNFGRAVDGRSKGVGGRELYETASHVKAFREGGIGIYVEQSSGRDRIHLDVRATGMARWGYVDDKKVTLEQAIERSM